MSEAAATYSAQDIEQLLRCPVCLDRLNNPRLLPCQHTFCTSPCLSRLAENEQVMKCPECRMESFIPYEGVQAYPINRTIQSFLDLQSQGGASGSTEPAPAIENCQICEQQGDIARCVHCNKHLCGDCKKSHFEQVKHDIGRLVNQVRRALPKISDSIQKVEQTTTQVKQTNESIKSEITTTIERAIKELRDREKMLHSEVETFAQGEVRMLGLHQESLEVELASMSSFCDSTEGSVSRNQVVPEQELVTLKKQCGDHMEHLRNFGRNSVLPTPREVRFTSEPQMLHSMISSFGELVALSDSRNGGETRTSVPPRAVPLQSRPQVFRTPIGPGMVHYVNSAPNLSQSMYRSPEAFMVNIQGPNNNQNRNNSQSVSTALTGSANSLSTSVARRPNGNNQVRNQSIPGSSQNNSTNGNNNSIQIPGSNRNHGNPSTTSPSTTNAQSLSLLRDQTFVRDNETRRSNLPRPNIGQQGVSFDVPLNETLGDFNIDEEIANLNREHGNTMSFRYSMGDSVVLQQSLNNYHMKGRMVKKIGNRGSESGRFTWPRGVAVSPVNDSIAVADSSNHRVQLFDCHYLFIKSFGSYGQGPGEFDCLAGIAVNHLGQIIVADRYNHRIQIFDRYGDYILQFGEEGTGEGQLSYPWGVACDDMGFIYVCDKDNHRIQIFQLDGTFVRKFGRLGSENGQFENPHYITVSSDRRIVVSDSSNHRIQVFNIYGQHQLTFGQVGTHSGQLKYPRGVAVDHQGFIVVADSGNNRIQVFRGDGRFHTSFGCWGSGDGQLKGLEGISLTSSGNIVVSDRENHRIQIF